MVGPEEGSGSRLGIFGGTFDPPHVGHVAVAEDVVRCLDLDRLIWIPALDPPHKPEQPLSPARLRLEMTRAAVAGHPRFEVSEVELRRPGPSYTVDTLRTLRAAHPSSRLFLVLGADQVRTLATGWREPTTVLRLATLALMDRAGEDAMEVGPELPGMERAIHVPVRRVDVSSTEVRARVAEGKDISGLVSPGTLAVIEREGLYRR
ncbi:MAG: nicotinate-nucleotide adenylyltransferase [Gemmatimonadetes bacterium]|nr:nicotinate-nucleotide adenylyltransferase [Gemmatimonadota bacterium]